MPARLILLLLVLLLFLVVPSAGTLVTEWFWFNEVDYSDIFIRTLTTKASVGGFVFLVARAGTFARGARSAAQCVVINAL